MKKRNVILAADIGGTNASFGLVDISGKYPVIIHKARFDTKGSSDFSCLLGGYLNTMADDGFEAPKKACFAIAGPVEKTRGRLTNTELTVDAKEVIANSPLAEAIVINDFAAVSYAVPGLQKKDLNIVKNGKKEPQGPIAVIGAGTGFGKSLLVWDNHTEGYAVAASEAGHCDLPAHTTEELRFIEHTKKRLFQKEPAEWETALSGRGLENIYAYLKARRPASGKGEQTEKIPGLRAEEIGARRKTDPLCKETFRWFETFYARAAKNTALENLATGGIYIAGGIVTKNQDMFTSMFNAEFMDSLRHKDLLKRIPVFSLKNNDASLIGCAIAMGSGGTKSNKGKKNR